jgi:RHS repeat-associated protein
LPSPVSSVTYDAADELKTWNGGSLTYTYDANGNLATDGLDRYEWNERNQLYRIRDAATNAVKGEFQYDAFGRRVKRTLGTTVTQSMYDGLNALQEFDANGAVTANLLGGFGIDELFSRTMSSGGSTVKRVLLPDALGSTLALTDPAGASVRPQYRYEPFGRETFVTNSPGEPNAYQFTGRENDAACQGGSNPGMSCTTDSDCPGSGMCIKGGPSQCQGGSTPGASCATSAGCNGGTCVPTGLYYYRARYYSPAWGRFISDDPLGLGAGMNVYLYGYDNPLNFIDPWGLNSWRLCGGRLDYVGDDGHVISSWQARSGPFGNGALPSGNYTLNGGPSVVPSEHPNQESFCDPTHHCWWQPMTPGFDTTRSGLGIHPDGGVPGTSGCIGVQGTDTSSLYNILRQNPGLSLSAGCQ